MNGDFEATFKVGTRYRCTLRLPVSDLGEPVGIIGVAWAPETPSRLTKAEMQDYRRGRDALLAEVERHIGGSVAVVEV